MENDSFGSETSSPPTPIGVEEQIKIILYQDAVFDVASWALQYLGLPAAWRDMDGKGNRTRCAEAVRSAITVSRRDINDYLVANSILPEDWFAAERGAHDDLYVIRESDGWLVYWQERGIQMPPVLKFSDLDEVRKLLVNIRLGPWLNHLHAGCMSTDGIVSEI